MVLHRAERYVQPITPHAQQPPTQPNIIHCHIQCRIIYIGYFLALNSMQSVCYSGGRYINPRKRPPRSWSVYRPPWAPVCRLGETQDTCTAIQCGSQMRRKAETLRHLDNSAHMTKKQKYSYAMRYGRTIDSGWCGASPRCDRYVRGWLTRCSARRASAYYHPSNSGVPGGTPLTYDRSVGLMNYRRVLKYPTASQVAHISLPDTDDLTAPTVVN